MSTLPGLPGGEPLPRRALLDALNVWLPIDDPDPFPDVSARPEPARDPYLTEIHYSRWIRSMQYSVGMTRPNSHAVITGVEDPGTIEEIMDDLFLADPEGYRLLSEHVVVPDPVHDEAIRAIERDWSPE